MELEQIEKEYFSKKDFYDKLLYIRNSPYLVLEYDNGWCMVKTINDDLIESDEWFSRGDEVLDLLKLAGL